MVRRCGEWGRWYVLAVALFNESVWGDGVLVEKGDSFIFGASIPTAMFEMFIKQEIWVDAGTEITRIYHKEKLILEEPTRIAVNRTTNEVTGVGIKACEGHDIRLIEPVSTVIKDFNAFHGP